MIGLLIYRHRATRQAMGFVCVVVKEAILNVIVMKMTTISTSIVTVHFLNRVKKKSI